MKEIKAGYKCAIVILIIIIAFTLGRYNGKQTLKEAALLEIRAKILGICETGAEFIIYGSNDIYSCYNVTTSSPKH